jgi:hypothetical protein
MLARKQSLARLARSSSRFLSRSARSKRLRSVMSRMELVTSSPSRLQRAQADLHRELRAVQAAAVELAALAHGPPPRLLEVAGALRPVMAAEELGHERLHRLAQELLARVAEELLGPRVHQHDAALAVDDDDRVGGRLQQAAELLVRLLLARVLALHELARHVAREEQEADHPRAGVTARGQDGVGDEHLPVLAAVGDLARPAAGGDGGRAQLRGAAGLHRLRGVERRRVQAGERLFRRVAVEALSAVAPERGSPLHVLADQGILGRRVEHEGQCVLLRSRRRTCRSACRSSPLRPR